MPEKETTAQMVQNILSNIHIRSAMNGHAMGAIEWKADCRSLAEIEGLLGLLGTFE